MFQLDWFEFLPKEKYSQISELGSGPRAYMNSNISDIQVILRHKRRTFADSMGDRAISAKNSADAEAARYR